MEIRGFEPLTLGLQSRCSSQLSYIPWLYINKREKKRKCSKVKSLLVVHQPFLPFS